VSEETEGQDTGAEASGAGVDPFAAAMALSGASREKADAFLDNQNSLIDIQKHHLHRQLTSLDLGIWEKRLGVLLRIATAFTGLAIAAGLAFMVWDAAHGNGLLIEPFSVPPDLASRGLTGEVVAARILDRLNELQTETSSQRAPKSYAHSWGPNDIKIDIPETGVSLGELDSFLREKLGHDTHVNGEIVRTDTGLSLTVRAGADGSASIAGRDTEMDALVQKLAESVYRLTQPYRYGIYLGRVGQNGEAIRIFQQLATTGSVEERPWGYNGWQFQLLSAPENAHLARHLLDQAVTLDPNFVLGWENIEGEEEFVQPEAALRDGRRILSLLSGDGKDTIRPDAVPYVRLVEQAAIDRNLGAFAEAAREDAAVVQFQGGRLGGSAPSFAAAAQDQASAHNLDAASATLANPVAQFGVTRGRIEDESLRARLEIASQAEDWPKARLLASQAIADHELYRNIVFGIALSAYTEARLGNIAAAEKQIAPTPADCYYCLRFRAQIAELKGEHARADWWFARAIQSAPSIPCAYADWGQALLARGKPDEAIEKFTVDNKKGPKFADPLEMWGEALMAKNQSHLALAKFEEADKYAPNWGRLHLKWGEALAYAGKADEAKAQFTRAAQLYLTPADKTELARVSGHG
jgi:Tfp pilus assembly protein PilF